MQGMVATLAEAKAKNAPEPRVSARVSLKSNL